MKVEQVMKQAVQACHAHDSLERAAQLMWDHDCGCVPVVDNAEHVVGMITDRDVCMASYTKGGTLRELRVEDAMSKKVCVCREGDRVENAERMMSANQIHRLPIVDADGHLVGILSLNDLAQEAGREGAKKKAEVTFSDVGQTLGSICRPRGSRAIAVAA